MARRGKTAQAGKAGEMLLYLRGVFLPLLRELFLLPLPFPPAPPPLLLRFPSSLFLCSAPLLAAVKHDAQEKANEIEEK